MRINDQWRWIWVRQYDDWAAIVRLDLSKFSFGFEYCFRDGFCGTAIGPLELVAKFNPR